MWECDPQCFNEGTQTLLSALDLATQTHNFCAKSAAFSMDAADHLDGFGGWHEMYFQSGLVRKTLTWMTSEMNCIVKLRSPIQEKLEQKPVNDDKENPHP